MLKTGLNIARFRKHIPMIEEETIEYFKQWGDAGERGLMLVSFVRCLVNKFNKFMRILPHS